MSPHIRRTFLHAAEHILDGGFTYQALRACTDSREDAEFILTEYFRPVFESPEPWPVGDQETRCLAFLFLIEFYAND